MSALQRGDTFYYSEGGHLWVVISDPSSNGGVFVSVNITKDWFRAGSECELLPGEHSWISCKSYINFGDPLKMGPTETTAFAKAIASGIIKKHLPVSAPLLQKIVEAGKKSKALSEELIALL